MKKITLALMALLLVFGAAGCSRGDAIFRCDIANPVQNLDPQFATEPAARMIIGNLFEGLVVRAPDGTIAPGAAESYTVSDDGLRYTFVLRENACWADGTPLTAHDFVYTFRRLFNPDARSPYASDFDCIAGAEPVLQKQAAAETLGVATGDGLTLTITLERASPFFLERLTSTAAMPCNEAFFQGARGRYGLESQLLLTNGPFELERWDNSRYIRIRKSDSYVSEKPTLPGGVNFYIGRGDPAGSFLDGKADVAEISYEDALQVKQRQADIYPTERTVWCIVFNQDHPLWGNAPLRQGLSQSLDRALLAGQLSAGLTPTEVFVPPAMRLLDAYYREYAGDASPLPFDPERGKYLFELGLGGLGLEKLPSTAAMLVPEVGSAPLYMGWVQQSWQKHLAAHINIERATAEQMEQALRSGEYQMLLMPFSPDDGRLQSLLGAFVSGSGQNCFGYHSARFDAIYNGMLQALEAAEALLRCRQAESLLLSDAVVVPVYFETAYYAVAAGVEGVRLPLSGESLYFKYATKR